MRPRTADEWKAFYRGLATSELAKVAEHIDRERLPDRARMADGVLRSRGAEHVPEESSGDPYGPQFRRLSIWRGIFFGSWGAMIPAEMLIGNPLGVYFHSSVPFFVVFAVAIGLGLVANSRIYGFRCPRCEKPFTMRRYRRFIRYRNVFTSECLHCGLARTNA